MHVKLSLPGIGSECHGQKANVKNATEFCVKGFWVKEQFLCWGFRGWHFFIGVLSRVPKTPLAFAITCTLDEWHTVIWFIFCNPYVRRHEYTSLQLPIHL